MLHKTTGCADRRILQYMKGISLYLTIALYLSQSAPYFLLHACSSLNSRCTAQQDTCKAQASMQAWQRGVVTLTQEDRKVDDIKVRDNAAKPAG